MTRAMVVLVILLLGALLVMPGSARLSEHRSGIPVVAQPGWPAGLADLLNSPGRVYGYWMNGRDDFYYAGDTQAFNAFIAEYARLDGTAGTLTVHPGQGDEQRLKERNIRYDWVVAVGGRTRSGEDNRARVDVWLGGQIEGDKMRVPSNVKVEGSDEVQQSTGAVSIERKATVVVPPDTPPVLVLSEVRESFEAAPVIVTRVIQQTGEIPPAPPTVEETVFGNLKSVDIGQPSVAGSVEVAAGSCVVKASGLDIWYARDQFRLVYLKVSGDFEAVARIKSLEATHLWTKAGLMARQSTDASSSHAFPFVTPEQGSCFQWRRAAGGPSEPDGDGTPYSGLPMYLKLVRKGNEFSSFRSKDGKAWEENHSIECPSAVNFPMKDPILVGLAVTSHSPGMLTTAVFDHFTVNGRSPFTGGEINTADGFNAVPVNRKGEFILTMDARDISEETPLEAIHIRLPDDFGVAGARVVGDVKVAGRNIGARSVQEGRTLKVALQDPASNSGNIVVRFEAVAGAQETSSVAFAVQLMTSGGEPLIEKMNGADANGNIFDLNRLEGIAIISDSPLSRPTNVRAETVPGENDARITWESGDERTKAYEVHANGENIGEVEASEASSYTQMSLEPGTTISYTVTGLATGALKSSPSLPATVTVGRDTTPPEAVRGRAFRITPETVTLTWSAASHDVARYVIYRGESEADLKPIAEVEAATNDYVDETGDTYLYAIEVYDDQGNPCAKPLPILPSYCSEKPLFAKVAVNEDGSTILCVAFDESQGTGEGYDVFYADVNMNGKFDADERFEKTPPPPILSTGLVPPGWSSSTFPPVIVNVPYNEKGEGVSDPCKVTFRFQRYLIGNVISLSESGASLRPIAPAPREIRQELVVQAIIWLRQDGAIWEYLFGDIIRPYERIEDAVVWRFGGKPELEVSTRPDGRKEGNLGIGLELKAGGQSFLCRKEGSLPEAHVEIKNSSGKVVHQGSAALNKFAFG